METRFQGYDCDGIPQWAPAVNVKIYNWDVDWAEVLEGYDGPTLPEDAFRNAVAAIVETDLEWMDYATEDAFAAAQGMAEEMLGDGAKVHQEGRTDGWLVVTGWGMSDDRDFPNWTDDMHTAWARFEQYVATLVADYPTAVTALVALTAPDRIVETAYAMSNRARHS